MSAPDLDSIRSVARARTQYLIVWNAIFLWDTFCTLRLERRAIWKAKWTLMKALYLLNRYGSLLLCLGTMLTLVIPMGNATCSRVAWVQLTEVVYVLFICHAILSVRLYAIFDRNQILKWGLIVWLVGETSLAIAAMSLLTPLDLSRPIAKYIELEGCITTRKPGSPNLVLGIQIVPAIFETGQIAAIAWKHWRTTKKIGTQIPILNRLLFDGIFYYVLITAVHLTTAFMYAHGDVSVKTFNVPCSIVLGSLACSRLVLSLKGRPQTQPVLQSLPSTL